MEEFHVCSCGDECSCDGDTCTCSALPDKPCDCLKCRNARTQSEKMVQSGQGPEEEVEILEPKIQIEGV